MKNAHTINAAVNRIADDIDEFADEYAAEHVRTHRADVAANPEHVADEIRHEIAAFAINRAFDEFPTDAAAFVAARADIAEHVRETAAHIRGEIRDAAAALNAAANDTPATDADETDEIEITTFAAVVLAAVTVFAAVGAFGGNAVVALFPAFGVVAILAGGFLAELSDIVAAGPGDTPGAFAARITDEYGDAVAGRHPDYRRALTARIAERIRAEFPETADTADGIASDAVAVAVPVTPHRFYRSDDTPDTPRREYPHRTAADRIADAYNRVTAVIGVNTPAGIVAAVAYTGGLLALTQFVAIPNAVISAAIFGATFAGRGGFDPFADGDPADAFADAFADADTDTIGDILADADLFDGNADALTEFAADRRQYGFAPPRATRRTRRCRVRIRRIRLLAGRCRRTDTPAGIRRADVADPDPRPGNAAASTSPVSNRRIRRTNNRRTRRRFTRRRRNRVAYRRRHYRRRYRRFRRRTQSRVYRRVSHRRTRRRNRRRRYTRTRYDTPRRTPPRQYPYNAAGRCYIDGNPDPDILTRRRRTRRAPRITPPHPRRIYRRGFRVRRRPRA